MNVAIAGAGIAGGYLAKVLCQKGISADVYRGRDQGTRCKCRSCAWGVPRNIETYLADIDLDFNEYLIEPMDPMSFDGIVANTPLCTLNKPRLIRDLTKGIQLKCQDLETKDAEKYDIIVDATGISRALLPPCRSDLILPTLQQRVVVKSRGSERLPAGVYGTRLPGLGYVWVFPLGNNHFHIGIGGLGLDHLDTFLDQFFQDLQKRFSFTTLCSCEGSIRVASPYYSTPLYVENKRQDSTPQVIVGIGESIGTVAPFTGEGITYSLECARIFADSWPDYERYSRAVLARFGWMKKERETLDYLLSQQGKSGPRLQDRWRFFCNARRSGIGLPLIEAFRQIGALSQWVEGPRQKG